MARKSFKQKAARTISKVVVPIVKLYWFVFRPESRGAKCIIEYKGRIFLVQHTYGKTWNLPGGYVKAREEPLDAARRELKEELDIVPTNLHFLGSFLNTDEHLQDTVFCFSGEVNSDVMKINRLEIWETGWFSPTDLPRPLAKVAKQAIDLRNGSRIL